MKRFCDPQSHSLREATTFEVHANVKLPQDEMFRMCPTFVQRRKEAQHVDVAAPTDEDAAAAATIPALDKYVEEMRPFAFASLAYVDEYKHLGPSVTETTYRIYADLLKIRIDDNDAADTARRLPDDFLSVDNRILEGPELTRYITEDNPEYVRQWTLFQDGQFLVIEPIGAPERCVQAPIRVLSIRNNVSTVEFAFETDDEAEEFDRMVDGVAAQTHRLYWVPGRATTREQTIGALRFFAERDSTVPAKVYGIVSRYEDAYRVGSLVSVANVMQGRAYLLVQPRFYHEELWVAGDDVYALMLRLDGADDSPFDMVQRYEITYVHYSTVEAHLGDPAYSAVYIGQYINTSDHAHYTCCTVTLPPLIDERIVRLGT